MSGITQGLMASINSGYRFKEDFNTLDTAIWVAPPTMVMGTVSGGIYTQTGNGSVYRGITNINPIVSGDFTLEFRASITTTNAGGHFMFLTNGTKSMGFGSQWNINSTNTFIRKTDGTDINLTNYHDNTYHIWKIVRVGTTITYYIDGVLKGTETGGDTTDYKFYAQNYDNLEQLNIDYIYVT